MSISVEDQTEIARLMYRYARCADRKDYPGFAEVFTADAVFDYRGQLVTPVAAIQQMMLALEKYSRTLHQVQNVLYDVEGDSASGETYCVASHIFEQDGREHKIDMGIIYNDSLLRTTAGWRIARRDFNLLWSQTLQIDIN